LKFCSIQCKNVKTFEVSLVRKSVKSPKNDELICDSLCSRSYKLNFVPSHQYLWREVHWVSSRFRLHQRSSVDSMGLPNKSIFISLANNYLWDNLKNLKEIISKRFKPLLSRVQLWYFQWILSLIYSICTECRDRYIQVYFAQ